MLRDMVDVTDDKSLTQGTIFNCAYCASYPNNETLGLVITARCDIANKDKVKFFNFIPAIPFEIWKDKELLPLIKKKVFKNLESQYFELLAKAGFSKLNIETYGFDRIYNIIVEKKQLSPKEITRLNNLKEKINCIEQNSSYSQLVKYFRDEISKILSDIIENKNSDYFFIDGITGYNSVIVNLREIYDLDISTARKIPDGIELDDGEIHLGLNLNIPNKFCSIVGQLRSPFTELLIQRFANNFVRVGVANHHMALLNNIMDV
ncbi:hypothetical protein LMA04_17100 [Pseudescherichia vulneris]|uniref:hypothetical protein n=1 Tax=Pseudescherichia vulneris TaxID=566 RepID=UPI00227C6E7F|nr:hypothetical protein [Pseudescherichia vulneris]WAH51800.1 hypothetical protein LMA04_17100 [Pseudescherichia vulneris]